MNIKKEIEKLQFKDDFMFYKVMQNKYVCKKIIETILNIKIESISYASTQETIISRYDKKAVRLDVLIADEKGTSYAIEMQVAKEPAIGKRSRYYHSAIDSTLLQSGSPYKELPPSFVIFICDYDPHNFGESIYHFEMTEKHNFNLKLGEEAYTILLNTNGDKSGLSDELSELLS